MAVVFALETKHRAILLIVHVVLSEDFLLFFIREGILETVGRLMPDVTTVVAADALHVLWIDPCCHLYLNLLLLHFLNDRIRIQVLLDRTQSSS
jgi:hypothetical protein